MDMSTVGKCFANQRYGTTVQFWCEAVDGGPTDSKLIDITFENEDIAKAVSEACKWRVPLDVI